MAFKLTKAEIKKRDEILGRLNDADQAFEDAKSEKEETDEQKAARLKALTAAVTDFNAAVEEAEAFREEIATRFQEEFDEKSEKWQEGEKGEAVAELIDAWESAGFEAPGVDENVAEQELESNIADELEELPTEVE